MGTDASLTIVETKIDDKWVAHAEAIWPEPKSDNMSVYPMIPREYELFSILADVRNRSGRGTKSDVRLPPEAGGGIYVYDTDDGGHDPLIPISNPKGMPPNASSTWRLGVLLFGMRLSLHDLTYLTLEELTTDLWDQQIFRDAYLTEEQYLDYRDNGVLPELLPRATNPDAVVNEVEYEAGKRGTNGSTAVFTRWKARTVRESCPWLFDYFRIMESIAPDNDPSKVRLMVAFDS